MADVNSHRSALGVLFDTVTDANGWSARDVERRSRERGEGISRTRIGQLVNENPLERFVNRETILALADGLGVSAERVAVAVVQAMGFRIDDPAVTPAEAIARDPGLSADTKTALLSILRAAGAGERERRRGA